MDELLSPAQFSRRAGLSLPYVYTRITDGRLPAERIEGRWRIRASELKRWEGRRQAREAQETA